MARIYIDSLSDGYLALLEKGFAFLGNAGRIGASDRVCIKPNLTFPTFRKGVMTNPQALEALIVYLKSFTDRITICESDSGGYNRFSMDEVFERVGINRLAKRYGVSVVNMSSASSRPITCSVGIRRLTVPIPTLLLDEMDVFVSVPVPKVHLNTVVSLALKNQWGVIQDPRLRLRLHPYFKYVVHAINEALPRPIAVVDGRYGLNRSGPMRGDVVRLEWGIVSDDLFATDCVVADLMGLNPWRIGYLKYCMRKHGLRSVAEITFNTPNYRAFRRQPFRVKRAWTDYPGVLTFNSRLLAYLGYESLLARPLHWLLYKFREPFY